MHIKQQRKVIDLKLEVLDDERVKDGVTETVELDGMELLVDRKDSDVMQIGQFSFKPMAVQDAGKVCKTIWGDRWSSLQSHAVFFPFEDYNRVKLRKKFS